MLRIKLNRYPTMVDSLINTKGQSQDQIYLQDSFTLNYFRNEELIKFDSEEDSWYLDLATLAGSGPPGPPGPPGQPGTNGTNGNDGEIFNAVVYETLDGNEIPAISSGEPYELLRRNLENDGYDFVGISQLAADINAYNYNQGFNQF